MLICPFMSGPVPMKGSYDEPSSMIDEAPCLEQNCALWMGVNVVEIGKTIDMEYGCSFKMLVMKMAGVIEA